jgi:hypothetical protein
MSDKLRRISPKNSLSAVLSAAQDGIRRAALRPGARMTAARTTLGTTLAAKRRSAAEDSVSGGRVARWA